MIVERALMEGTLDPLDFILAENLHKTLDEVRAMSNAEHVEWRAFYVWRKAKLDFEADHGR
jgi:hypothetical protein